MIERNRGLSATVSASTLRLEPQRVEDTRAAQRLQANHGDVLSIGPGPGRRATSARPQAAAQVAETDTLAADHRRADVLQRLGLELAAARDLLSGDTQRSDLPRTARALPEAEGSRLSTTPRLLPSTESTARPTTQDEDERFGWDELRNPDVWDLVAIEIAKPGDRTRSAWSPGQIGLPNVEAAFDDVEIGAVAALASTFFKKATSAHEGDGQGNPSSPVMLDLNHDGRIGVTGTSTAQDRRSSQTNATVDFDIDADGRKDRIEWSDGRGDAFLVDDRDGSVTRASQGNGEISGRQLFGDQGGRFANGYDKLAGLDANRDGKLTGSELRGLKAWIDDGDAKVEAGELVSLAELGVSEVSVRMQLAFNERGEALMRSSFTQHGESRMTEDVWFGRGDALTTGARPSPESSRFLEGVATLVRTQSLSEPSYRALLGQVDEHMAMVNGELARLLERISSQAESIEERGASAERTLVRRV